MSDLGQFAAYSLGELIRSGDSPSADGVVFTPTLDEPFPCQGCEHVKHCAALEHACDAFGAYTSGLTWHDEPREPSRAAFVRIYDEAIADDERRQAEKDRAERRRQRKRQTQSELMRKRRAASREVAA